MTGNLSRMGALLAVVAASYLLICLLAFLFQRHFVYFPVKWSEAEASRWNPGHETVRFRASDGETIHGWLHRDGEAPWTVVIFHGNAGNLSHHEPAMRPFVALGLQVLLFDYRGFGLSTGRPDERGLLRDGDAAVEFVEKELGVPPEATVYYGQSLGTGVATLLAARRPPGRLILESSFDSLAAVARHHYPYLPVGPLLRDSFDSLAVIGRVRCPILVLHSTRDEIVPLSRGRALFEKAGSPKRFVVIPGAGHNDPPDPGDPLRMEALREFLGLAPDRGKAP